MHIPLTLIIVATALAAQPARSTVQTLVDRSNFIFQGVVLKLNASTDALVEASPATVVVRVEKVLQGADLVSDMTDKEITVRLLKPGTVKREQRLLFFTSVSSAGKSVVVNEISRGEPQQADAAATAVKEKPDRELRDRLVRAALVVTGRVTEVAPLDQARRQPPPSEHEPEWSRAVIQVESTEKGQPPESVILFFPSSIDIRWFRSPKFTQGQEGVFILQRPDDPRLPKTGFTALHPLDFRTREERDRVKRLLSVR